MEDGCRRELARLCRLRESNELSSMSMQSDTRTGRYFLERPELSTGVSSEYGTADDATHDRAPAHALTVASIVMDRRRSVIGADYSLTKELFQQVFVMTAAAS